MDRGVCVERHRHDMRGDPQGTVAAGAENTQFAAASTQSSRTSGLPTARSSARAMGRARFQSRDAMRNGKVDRIELETTTKPGNDGKYARNTHSAIFAEVKVDEQLGVIRVTRVVSAVAGGRILNTKTAHSQIMGSVVWGIGMALHEETLVDHNFGRVMNANIAEYHVPVNADVYDIKVIFVDEPDEIINPLGIKGLGEIGIVGVAAAIANAVYHATGKRVRDLPITLDKLRRSLLSRRSSRPSCSTAQLDRCPLLAQSELFQRVRLTSGFGCAGASNPGAE